jgi:hypothetical protein
VTKGATQAIVGILGGSALQHPLRRRAVRDGLSLVGLAVLLLIVVAGTGSDAVSYWSFSPSAPYVAASRSLTADQAFRYGPPIALLFLPFHALPWPVFRILWLLVELAGLAAVARWWTLAAVAIYPVALELSVGNVHLLMALAVFFGLRFPELWSWILLTKVTPAVGLLWFVVRREWWAVVRALAMTVVLAVVTLLLRPDLWSGWLAMLWADAQLPLEADARYLPVPLVLRLPAAALLVVWGARRDDPRWLGLATCVALPTIWPQSLSLLILTCVPRERWGPVGPAGAPWSAAVRPD